MLGKIEGERTQRMRGLDGIMKNLLIGKDPDAGKSLRKEGRGRQKIRQLDGITKSMDVSLSKLQ